MGTSLTPIQQIGEFGLIEKIQKHFSNKLQKNTILGIGDDAAILERDEHNFTLISTDMLLEGIHFDLTYYPLKHLGYKAVVCNVSDIAAMNGIPEQITVSIALSSKFTVEAVEEIYEGIRLACENYKIDLIGGDTTTSRTGLVISVTAIGKVSKQKVVKRSGAKPNDIICVTGDLGGSYTGLLVLQREKVTFKANPETQPQLDNYDYVVKRHLKPEARTDVIHEFADLDLVPTAMIDISDGLASELLHISKNSKCGVIIFEDKLPIDPQTATVINDEFHISPTTAVLNGGEDYELLFTIRQQDYDKIKNHPDVTPIGYVTDSLQERKLILRAGTTAEIKAQGWTHF
ncbi:MAG: thiamine-phosphate kinase [Cytophagales bacterium]|nr:thiamine-phosphate kinase [Cytophagales bacterium]MDW8383820.1 thiamine-phosphate kinase [Flammeovirgaceae bacterium]